MVIFNSYVSLPEGIFSLVPNGASRDLAQRVPLRRIATSWHRHREHPSVAHRHVHCNEVKPKINCPQLGSIIGHTLFRIFLMIKKDP